MKSKYLLFIFSIVILNSSTSIAQKKKELIQYIDEQKDNIEQFIALSKLKIEIKPGKEEPFDPNDNFNFESNKNTQNLSTEKIQTFLKDNTKVGISFTPPYNIVRVSFKDYYLSELLGLGSFYFNKHPDELPQYKPLKVTYLDGTSSKAEDKYISKKNIADKLKAKGGNLKVDQLSSLEKVVYDDNSSDDLYFFQSPKPIESIVLSVDIKMAKSNTYQLSNSQKVVKTPYGNLKLDTIVGNKIYFSVPASIKENSHFEALYKDGRALRNRTSNYTSGLDPEKIEAFEKLITFYDKAAIDVKKGNITSIEMLNQALSKAMDADPEMAVLKKEQLAKYSMTFAGPISTLNIKVSDSTTQSQSFEFDFKMKYYDDEKEYLTAYDFETEKKGIINQQGEWIIKPIYDQYFRNLNKYFYWRQIDREQSLYRFIPSEKRLEKVEYNLDEIEVFAGKYVIIDPQVNGPEGVVDGSTGKIIIPMKHSFVNFVEGGFWLCRLETGNNYEYGNEGVYKLDGTILLPFEYQNVEYKNGFFYTKKIISKDANGVEKELLDMYNTKGENITNGKYDEFKYDYNNGLQLAIKRIKHPTEPYSSIGKDNYFINKNGKVVLSFPNSEYHDAEPFNNGLAKIEKRNNDKYEYDGDFGFIDSTGKIVIPYVYKDATNFLGSCALLSYEEKGKNKYALINKKNVKLMVWDIKYNNYWYDNKKEKYFFSLPNGDVYDFDGHKIVEEK